MRAPGDLEHRFRVNVSTRSGNAEHLLDGGVGLAERALALVVTAMRVLAGDASAAAAGTCEQPKK